MGHQQIWPRRLKSYALDFPSLAGFGTEIMKKPELGDCFTQTRANEPRQAKWTIQLNPVKLPTHRIVYELLFWSLNFGVVCLMTKTNWVVSKGAEKEQSIQVWRKCMHTWAQREKSSDYSERTHKPESKSSSDCKNPARKRMDFIQLKERWQSHWGPQSRGGQKARAKEAQAQLLLPRQAEAKTSPFAGS